MPSMTGRTMLRPLPYDSLHCNSDADRYHPSTHEVTGAVIVNFCRQFSPLKSPEDYNPIAKNPSPTSSYTTNNVVEHTWIAPPSDTRIVQPKLAPHVRPSS